MSEDEKQEARRRAEVDAKMKAMIREILFYLGFLMLLLIVVNGQQDTNSYRQNYNIINVLTVTSLNNVVSWIQLVIIAIDVINSIFYASN